MGGAEFQDAVESILLEWDGLRLPSAEGVPPEHCLERDEEDDCDRKVA